MATMNRLEPESLTVGQANLKAGADRCSLWMLAVFFISATIGTPMGVVYILYTDPDDPVGSLWHLVPFILWGVYMTLISVIVMHVNLYLLHTPVAVREAILDIGWGYIGIPLLIVAITVACVGLAWWVVATVVYVLVIVIFGTIAFWVRLVRTYRK